jgi:hypothetical protein
VSLNENRDPQVLTIQGITWPRRG